MKTLFKDEIYKIIGNGGVVLEFIRPRRGIKDEAWRGNRKDDIR